MVCFFVFVGRAVSRTLRVSHLVSYFWSQKFGNDGFVFFFLSICFFVCAECVF